MLGKWQQSQWLSLVGNCLDLCEHGLCCLSTQLPSLRALHICDTDIGNEHINELVRLQWPELEQLHLQHNSVMNIVGHTVLCQHLGTGPDCWSYDNDIEFPSGVNYTHFIALELPAGCAGP